MKLSLKNRIFNFLVKWYEQDPNYWVPAYVIEKLSQEIGYMASNSTRRLRELREAGSVERRINPNNRVAEYRYQEWLDTYEEVMSWEGSRDVTPQRLV